MSQTKKEVDAWSSAWLGKKLEEATPGDLRAVRAAGLLPAEVSRVLATIENDYDPDFGETIQGYDADSAPTRAEYTDKYQEIVFKYTSEVLSKAVHNGYDRVINRFVEIVEQDADISHLHPVTRFTRWLTREAAVNYIFAAPGNGKTDLGVLICEHFWKEFDAGGKEAHIATNIKSTAEAHDQVTYIDNYPDLVEWLKETDGFKHFLFDEASHHAHAFGGNNAKVVNRLGSMIKLIRKFNGGITIIGHTGKDLALDIRSLADAVKKEDKKTAVIYENVKDREGVGKKDRFENIPQTNWHYDTNENSDWSWGEKEEDEDDIDAFIAKTYHMVKESSLDSQKDVAEVFEVSQSKVSSAYRDYDPEAA